MTVLRKSLALSLWRSELLLLPAAAYLMVFFAIPVAAVVRESFVAGDNTSLANYFRIVQSPVYTKSLWVTLRISGSVTIISLILAYPVAYYLTLLPERARGRLVLIFSFPLWISVLVRSYAWLVLLQREGIVNKFLMLTGLADSPWPLVYNGVGVLLGMTYVMFPVMLLSLTSVLDGIDRTLLEAANTLGVGRAESFFRIYLPLSYRGIGAGCLLVFILSVGYFITPAILGGRHETMIAILIDLQMNRLLNWGFGSALAVYLMAIVALGFFIVTKLFRLDDLLNGKIN
jgi:putative spermidine/putrescine transport system permease protein